MVTAGEHRVARMVAVDTAGRIVPPCGRCREFISQLHDQHLDVEVLVNDDTTVTLHQLLPFDWRAARTNAPSQSSRGADER